MWPSLVNFDANAIAGSDYSTSEITKICPASTVHYKPFPMPSEPRASRDVPGTGHQRLNDQEETLGTKGGQSSSTTL
jgi:hypothetical protein